MSENESKSMGGKRRAKRLLSASQKYEIWLQLVRQEVTVAEVDQAPWRGGLSSDSRCQSPGWMAATTSVSLTGSSSAMEVTDR